MIHHLLQIRDREGVSPPCRRAEMVPQAILVFVSRCESSEKSSLIRTIKGRLFFCTVIFAFLRGNTYSQSEVWKTLFHANYFFPNPYSCRSPLIFKWIKVNWCHMCWHFTWVSCKWEYPRYDLYHNLQPPNKLNVIQPQTLMLTVWTSWALIFFLLLLLQRKRSLARFQCKQHLGFCS